MDKNDKNYQRVIIKQIVLYLIFLSIILLVFLFKMKGCFNK